MVINHGFADGNKRTGVLLTDLLIKNSGYRLEEADAHEDLGGSLKEIAVAVAPGELKHAAITKWFRRRIVRQ